MREAKKPRSARQDPPPAITVSGFAKQFNARTRSTAKPADRSRRTVILLALGSVVLIASGVLEAVGIHHLMGQGACSSTGYNEYGPVQKCGPDTGWYIAMIAVGVLLAFAAMATQVPAWTLFLVLFVGIGVGSLTAGLGSAEPGAGREFTQIFGGAFAVFGVGLAALFYVVKRNE